LNLKTSKKFFFKISPVFCSAMCLNNHRKFISRLIRRAHSISYHLIYIWSCGFIHWWYTTRFKKSEVFRLRRPIDPGKKNFFLLKILKISTEIRFLGQNFQNEKNFFFILKKPLFILDPFRHPSYHFQEKKKSDHNPCHHKLSEYIAI
jgi:hypothetical protein